jgi:hypothetical protein
MIKDKFIKVNLNSRNINKIRDYKSDKTLVIGDLVEIPLSMLDKGSHVRVSCVCDICGLEKNISYQKYIKNISNSGYYSCSSKCSQNKVKKTSLDKWGEEYYMKTNEFTSRVNKTNLDKYGSEWYLTSKEGKEKISNIINEKYGVDNPFANKDIKSKIFNTINEKYGVDNISKNDKIRNKIGLKNKNVWDNKYKNYFKENYGLNIINLKSKVYHILCDVCDNVYDINKFLLSNRLLVNTKTCTICNPSQLNNRSGYETQLLDYIKTLYSGSIICNQKIIKPYELDIYLPDLNLAFEFNGLWWHSDLYKPKDYHYRKHKMCKDKDIELFQIWEDDWLYKNDIVKSMISNKMGFTANKIWARKCDIRIVDHISSKNFLEKNHLQGNSKSKLNIGLYYRDELVSLMSFGSLRKSLGSKSIIGNYEIYRFCNKLNTSVVGGGSKLLKYFIKNYKFNMIISYYDKSFGFKSFYDSIGFKFIGETPINYFYLKSGIRLHRYNYRKSNLVKMGYDESLTENEITKKMGLNRIYGVGSYKFILESIN